MPELLLLKPPCELASGRDLLHFFCCGCVALCECGTPFLGVSIMDGWLEIGAIRILLAVKPETVELIETMSNSERMELRQVVSNGLAKAVDIIVSKPAKG